MRQPTVDANDMIASSDGLNEYRIDRAFLADPFREDYTMRVKTYKYINGIGESKEAKKYTLKIDKDSKLDPSTSITEPPPK